MNAEKILQQEECEVISFPQEKNLELDNEIKFTKKGGKKKTPNNSKKGVAHEVYPIKDKEQVKSINKYFSDKIYSASDDENRQIAARNQMMWVIGINIGLRASDLRALTWGDIFEGDDSFKEGVRKEEKKTRKFKTFFFNKYVVEAVTNYVEEFKPCVDKDIHLFRSREGGAIEVGTIRLILKEAAKACGVKQNVGSHTLRKTFGYHWYMAHKGDINALVHLQRLFNHSSPQVTLAYIGIEDEKSKQFYDDLEW